MAQRSRTARCRRRGDDRRILLFPGLLGTAVSAGRVEGPAVALPDGSATRRPPAT
jgi:hypothetical protein